MARFSCMRDELIISQIHSAVREDYANTSLSVQQIASKHGISIRTVYSWSQGLKRHARRANKYIMMRVTSKDLDDLILAVMEAEKSAKGDDLDRLNNLEDRLASKSEEFYFRNHS